MAIKGSATITLTQYRDTQSVTRYYKLQPAGSSAPLKPETKPPSSDWTDSEPACDISKELYFCDLTIFSNGEGEYSKVSKSTSYEAAKQAYNKAHNAQTSIDNLEIGGRNLIKNSNFTNGFDYWNKYGESNIVDGWCEVTISSNTWGGIYQSFTPIQGVKYILSYEAYLVDTSSDTAILESDFGSPDQNVTIDKTPRKYSTVIKYPNQVTGYINFQISLGGSEAGKKWRIRKIKLETGDKSTDWTPAPEDMASKDELVSTNESIRQDVENNYYSHTELGQSLSFNETDGLIIQVPNSPYETRISNTQIEFRYQGQPVAYINGEILVIPKSMMLDEMMVGNNKWSWRIRDNGNLQLKWIG